MHKDEEVGGRKGRIIGQVKRSAKFTACLIACVSTPAVDPRKYSTSPFPPSQLSMILVAKLVWVHFLGGTALSRRNMAVIFFAFVVDFNELDY